MVLSGIAITDACLLLLMSFPADECAGWPDGVQGACHAAGRCEAARKFLPKRNEAGCADDDAAAALAVCQTINARRRRASAARHVLRQDFLSFRLALAKRQRRSVVWQNASAEREKGKTPPRVKIKQARAFISGLEWELAISSSSKLMCPRLAVASFSLESSEEPRVLTVVVSLGPRRDAPRPVALRCSDLHSALPSHPFPEAYSP
jgi:hypothetical protein